MSSAGKTHVCVECGAQFKTRSGIKQHVVARHHPQWKQHPCTRCEKKFISSTKLRLHEATHTTDMPYQCTTCLRRFRRGDHLEVHTKLIHQKIKQYACNVCSPPRHFGEKSKLENHQKLHQRAPKRCGTCPAHFLTTREVQQHARREHPKASTVTCAVCGTEMAATSLRAHVMSASHLENEQVLEEIFADD